MPTDLNHSASPSPTFRHRLARFARIRMRRVLGYAIISALLALVLGFYSVEPDFGDGLKYIVASNGINDFLANIQLFLFFDVLPVLVFVALVFLAGMVAGGVAMALAAVVLPRAFMEILDGVVMFAITVIVINVLSLDEIFNAIPFGEVLLYFLIWSLVMATTELLWDRLPFGFNYRTDTSLDFDMPIDALRACVIPDIAPDKGLADAAWHQDPSDAPEGFVPLEMNQRAPDTYSFREPRTGKHGAYRELTYRLTQIGPNHTKLEIRVSLKSLAPWRLWAVWALPYGEDFGEHLAARISGQKDRSAYGAHINKYLKRLARRSGELRPA